MVPGGHRRRGPLAPDTPGKRARAGNEAAPDGLAHNRSCANLSGVPHPSDDRARLFELDGLDPRSAAVFGAFMRARRLGYQLMLRALADDGTPPGQAMLLRLLAMHDGATQRELADMLHLSAPTVTAMLKRMERGGSIARTPDPHDQRVTRVSLTPAGREKELLLHRVLAARIGRLLAGMADEDRLELARLLDDFADRMAADEGQTATGPDPEPKREPTTGRERTR